MTHSLCKNCGEPIDWRVSKRTGRKYPVNAGTSTFHSTTCKARSAKIEQPVPSTAREYVQQEPRTDLATIIAAHVASLLPPPEAVLDEEKVRAIVRAESSSALDEERVRSIARSEVSGNLNVVVSVRDGNQPEVNVGRQHKLFPTLLAIIGRRRNLWLTGPAGSGKTRAAHNAADALNLAFGAISVGPQTTQSALFGYMDAHGNYVATEFRRRYAEGGVFLFDEIDRGNPGVLTALNQAIENGTCAFPDRMVTKHPDFVAIAAANTYGTGANREYVGALQLDAATLDRFVMLEWNYDEDLERALTQATWEAAGGTDQQIVDRWLAKVRKARERASELKVRHVISPRASIVGADLLASGLDEATVESIALWKGLDEDTVGRLQ